MTEPDEGISGRSLQWPCGKVLGGPSSINGLLYVRGQAEDYDRWADLGNRGWAFDDVPPCFKRSEDQERGADEYHGIDGPLKVSDLRLRRPIADCFIQAATETRIPLNEDYNGASQEGAGYFQQTAHKGFRWITAKGFLRPARKRPNLRVETNAQTTRILFEGRWAVGTEYRKGGSLRQVKASAEVILSAGALGSPQILQVSGVGSGELLQKLGVTLGHDLSGIGQNLQDHLQIRLIFKTDQRTLNDEVNNLSKQAWVGSRCMLTRFGALILAASQVTIFTKTDPSVERPDIQFHMQPLSADKPGDGAHKFSASTSSVCQLRPHSRGHTEIKSSDPLEYPEIHPIYLSEERDPRVALGGVKLAPRIAEAPLLALHITDEYVPGRQFRSDEELLHAARQYSQTIYHPTSTCKMGHDEAAVVDDRLRVHGIQNLRVVDASMMPEIVSGNINAPNIMIVEKSGGYDQEGQLGLTN